MSLRKITFTIMVLFFTLFGSVTAQKTGEHGLRQPAQLFVAHETSDSNAYLYWWNPGDPTWLYYYNWASSYLPFDEGNYEVAIKYSGTDLAPYHEMGMSSLAFIGAIENVTYTLSVWSGNNGDVLEYEQQVNSITEDNWTYVDFTTPLIIDTSKTYYVGLAMVVEDLLGNGITAMVLDEGPAVESGNGNKIRNSDGNFVSLTELGDNYDYNWALALYIETPSVAKQAVQTQFETSHKICQTTIKELVKSEIKFPALNAKKSASAVQQFNVYRNNEIIATPDTAGYHDILADGGEYVYEVSAVYAEGESYKSDSYTIMYDDDRIPRNFMVLESFINTGALTEEQLQSPGSPGVVKGQREMDFQYDDVASIAYHSATEILGPDPFSFYEGELKFMEYFLTTFSFPCMHFNGSIYQDGGQQETMYFIYKDIYEAIKDFKTPIAQTSYIEGVSSNSFIVHSDYELVGIYELDSLVSYSIVTESNIAYDWNFGEFEEANFVARQILPSATGEKVIFENKIGKSSHEVETDPFVSKENLTLITYIQDKFTKEILNASKLSFPKTKVITFRAENKSNAVEEVAIEINNEIIYTDENGEAKIALFENIGDISYEATHEDYNTFTSSLNTMTTDTVLLDMTTVGINAVHDFSMKMYPNPTTDIVYLKANSAFNVQLSDLAGKIVYETNADRKHYEVNISAYNPGIYMVKVKTENEEKYYKLIKN